MASQFPGMDPYLEGNLWTGFHALFATQIVRELNRNLGPKYVAVAQQRFVMAVSFEISMAMADTVMPVRVPHTWVKILAVAKRKLVAVIEFHSPANKRGLERRKYLRKRERILLSSAHLLEIDLLRKGKRVPMQAPLPAADYYVLLSRAAKRPLVDIWPVTLEQTLPTVPVPLPGKDPDVVLHLQRVFSAVYDEGRYQSLIDYTVPPDVPLPRGATAIPRKRRKR